MLILVLLTSAILRMLRIGVTGQVHPRSSLPLTSVAKTEDGNLKFIFGDASTHGGEFIFATDVTGKLDKGWTWPVVSILSILKIADVNNTKMSISNEGAIQITLDSGLANYKYIIPAQAA